MVKLSKRQKFVIATFLLLVGIIVIRFDFGQDIAWRLRAAGFAVVSVLITIFALHDDDFNGIEWLTLPILPSMFALASALAYPLLPSHLEAIGGINLSSDTSLLLGLVIKIIFLSGFMIGYYATLLTGNIFNVAAVRSIQLLRVAHSIGFLVTVGTALMFYLVIASLHLSHLANFLTVFVVSLPLSFQAIWSINLASRVGEGERNFSLITALILAEIAWVLSFWPVGVSIFALFLTAIFYELVGIVQYHLGEKLNFRVANEFIFVAIAVFLLTIFTTVWGG